MTGDLLGAIGNTPLVKVPFDTSAEVLAKLEYLNPGGSIKDRSAHFMIQEAERAGLLEKGGTIVEASSGNQGIAIAMIGAVKGYRVIICVSEKISGEKLKALRAYGAEVVVCPATDFIEDPHSYHSQAVAIQKQIPGAFMPNQYFNISNPKSHYLSLGPEVWKQTDGRVTHFFAAAGTGGTVSGVGKYLKEQNKDVVVIAVDVDTSFRATRGHPKPYKMEGIGVDFKTPCLDESVVDEFVTVSDTQGLGMMKTLASDHGFLVGTSSGAVAYAVSTYLERLSKDDVVVMIFGDSGRAYLSKNYLERGAS